MHHGFPGFCFFFFPLILLHASITTKIYGIKREESGWIYTCNNTVETGNLMCRIQVVFCHEAAAPQLLSLGNCIWLYGSTIPSLHWYALMLKGFHVRSLSEQHDTLHHPSGEFFWKFRFFTRLYWSSFLVFFNNDSTLW